MWQRSHESCSEEVKLELRLGPPGEEYLNDQKNVKKEKYEVASSFLQLSSMPMIPKDASQPCFDGDKKIFISSSSNSPMHNSSQKRSASGPVVGWPPIRSFRKNIASGSSSKPPTGSQQEDKVADKVVKINKPIENSSKGLFVKVIMDGVPIGRKVDINAYDSYHKLSFAVDKLFISLLQELNLCHIVFSHGGGGGIEKKKEEGSLIESGEYSLVYEDNDGDIMLVGDVPWEIFVSTKVKRLRVLKTSDLPFCKKLNEAV